MGPFGTNPVRIDSQGNHVEPSGIEERIEQVLETHRLVWGVTIARHECACGQWCDSGPGMKRVEANHRFHVAAVVAQALQPSAAEQKLAAIRRLHFQRNGSEKDWCANCGLSWPCPTVRILDSDDPPCPHDSLSGDEGPIAELGRMPKRWRCDTCGAVLYSRHNLVEITEDADQCGYKARCECGAGFSTYTEKGAHEAHTAHQARFGTTGAQ